MPTENDFDPTQDFLGDAEAVIVEYADDLAAKPLIAPVNEWWKPWARIKTGARLKTRFYLPIASPEFKEWRGSAEWQTRGKVFTTIARKKWFYGEKADADKIAEFDFEAFGRAPEGIALAAGKLPGSRFGALINVAHTINDWSKTPFFVTTADKPVNPMRPRLGKWFNAYAGAALTVPNIKRAIRNLQSRKGFDGQYLEMAGTHLWLPAAFLEDGRDLTVVQQLIPMTLAGVSGGGNTNAALGRLTPVFIPNMRSDMWIVAEAPPDPVFAPFGYVTGGDGDITEANEDARNGTVPPHVEIVMKLRDDPLYKDKGQLAVGEIIREGHGLLTPHCLTANYTGNPTDAFTL